MSRALRGGLYRLLMIATANLHRPTLLPIITPPPPRLQEDSWLWSADSDGDESDTDAGEIEQRASNAETSVISGIALVRKPLPTDSLGDKEKFITSKYIHKR